MAREPLATVLAPLARRDGAWIRCIAPDCDAYFGAFRPTGWLAAKLADHAARKHGARRPAAGLRPQRRAVAALPQGAPDLAALLVGEAKRLGNGIARTAYVFGPDHVLKVANESDRKHNLAEMRSYESAPAWAKRLLAPAVKVADDGAWLVMRKAERVGQATWAECDALEAALKHKITDLHPQNVGWLDGRWVAIDYAQGWHGAVVAW